MKKLSFITIILAIAAMLTCGLPSCRELAQNGDFSGQWQIMTIEYPDGTTVDPEGTRYYCFYRDVAQLTATGDTRISGNLAYDEDARTFAIEFPYDSPVNLKPWGITFPDTTDPNAKGFTAHFTINVLTSERLVMTTEEGAVITCRKW